MRKSYQRNYRKDAPCIPLTFLVDRYNWYMRYWPSLFQSRWLDISRVLFCVLMRKKKKKTRELGQYLNILTEQAWSKKDFLRSKKITLYWVRVKNYFFTSRAAGRKSNLFVAHETHESSLCFLCFDCILPLFATPSPTLSKNYKLGRSAPRNFLQSPSCLLSDFSWQG